ncbi:Flp family type IVb pilin [bacterium]|nr:Flp family type IVb pilin [bacterium]
MTTENKDLQIQNKSEKGATMLEYALLAALIAVVCIVAITFLGQQASTSFSRVGSSLSGANG